MVERSVERAEAMRIAVVGSGYVGLVSGACLAEIGHDVVCIDSDAGKIAALRTGRMPFYEAGLEQLVGDNAAAGRLRFADSLADGVPDADAVILAVGTPSRLEDGEADLSYIHAAIDDLAEHLKPGVTLISKSTVPVGTGDQIAARLGRRRPNFEVDVVSCPEFLREGAAIEDFMRPHRILVGSGSPRGEAVLRDIYAPLIEAGVPFLVMDRRSAELAKYAANAFLATKLAFLNEIAAFAENVSADIEAVANAIGLDPRIGQSYLRVGPGFGGSCFPKDAMALHRTGEEVQASLRIVETVIAVNEQRKRSMAGRIVDAVGGDVDGKVIAVLGVTFKAGTDDVRDSPAIPIIRRLEARGAVIRAFDPGLEEPPTHAAFTNVEWPGRIEATLQSADAAVVVTDWDDFRDFSLSDMASRLSTPTLIDLRNLFDPSEAAAAGLNYFSLGRGAHRGKTTSERPASGLKVVG